MRKVLIKTWIPEVWEDSPVSGSKRRKEGTEMWSDYVVEGVFHQWGVAYEVFETGPGNYSVGIVELPDGRIESVLPSNIKFTSELQGTLTDCVNELIQAQENYIELLGLELSDMAGFLAVHGWKSARIEEGKVLRERIEKAKFSLTQQNNKDARL